MRSHTDRPGFALVTVLAIVVGLSAIAATIMTVSKDAVATNRNRINLAAAQYTADGCIAKTRAAIDEILGNPDANVVTSWSTLSAKLATTPTAGLDSCNVSIHAVGTTLDVNSSGDSAMAIALRAMGMSSPDAQRAVAALADWRDADDVARMNGAEADWYLGASRPGPRNRSLADPRELRLVRGFEAVPGIDSVLGVDSARIFLQGASIPVLATLPGFTSEVLAVIGQQRAAGSFTGDLIALADALPTAARDSIMFHYADIARVAGNLPDAWFLTATSESTKAGVPPAVATIEVKLVRSDTRAAVARRRTW
jgi:hypothetical protein